ncbi:MAG: hypothetical protein GTN38_00870 [Candidatus Aenigmarchaeota archaeon]|nr:hypothetical protein [Candidatus Aenigmarchaeota archaeon]NIP40139.1 hypothetical protein [Candidatus Aenigmarchaeota archaeon]NIQ18216.1 hypothetical protein [Candidatus Aenigmarchaeota archaeon]NIS72973.1 hypothetical protein [Candidatus Aenigmarchaeota archaeon]
MSRYVTSSQATRYTGMSKRWLRDRLDPVTDDLENQIRIGREIAYHTPHVRQLKIELDKETKSRKKKTLRPEDLSPEKRKELAKETVKYYVLGQIRGDVEETRRDSGDLIKKTMGVNTSYTGDGEVVKSISHYPRKETEVSVKGLSNLFTQEELLDSGIASLDANVKILRARGPRKLKEKLRSMYDEFLKFFNWSYALDELHSIDDEQLREQAVKFLREYDKLESDKLGSRPLISKGGKLIPKHRMRIGIRYFWPILKDAKNKRLGEKRLAMHARILIERYITETLKPKSLRITLTEEYAKMAEEVAVESLESLDLSKLDEMTEQLLVE